MSTQTETTTDTATDTPEPRQYKILVLQRGWVAIGRYHKDGADHVLADAAVVRRWGTAKGLGQLALSGPTLSTVLDPTGVVRAHELATVFVIDADARIWSGLL